MLADWTRRQLRLSVVVPAYKDNAALESLLPRLQTMLDEHDEVIVVDGDKDAACRELCANHSATYLTADPCRGLQMDTGARNAGGDVVWFLHADSEPDPDSSEHIRDARSATVRPVVFSGFTFSGNTPGTSHCWKD